jgi:hypothetical protein
MNYIWRHDMEMASVTFMEVVEAMTRYRVKGVARIVFIHPVESAQLL